MRSLFRWLCAPWVARRPGNVDEAEDSSLAAALDDRSSVDAAVGRQPSSLKSCFPFLRLLRTKRKAQRQATCWIKTAGDNTPVETAATLSEVLHPLERDASAPQGARHQDEADDEATISDADLHESPPDTCPSESPPDTCPSESPPDTCPSESPPNVTLTKQLRGQEEIFSPTVLSQGTPVTPTDQHTARASRTRRLVLVFDWDDDYGNSNPATPKGDGCGATVSEGSTVCGTPGESSDGEPNFPESGTTPQSTLARSERVFGPCGPAPAITTTLTDTSSLGPGARGTEHPLPAAEGSVKSCQRVTLLPKAVVRGDPMLLLAEKALVVLLPQLRERGVPLPHGSPRRISCRILRITGRASSARAQSSSREIRERRARAVAAGSQADILAESSCTVAA